LVGGDGVTLHLIQALMAGERSRCRCIQPRQDVVRRPCEAHGPTFPVAGLQRCRPHGTNW
jgi:hypothetical protein